MVSYVYVPMTNLKHKTCKAACIDQEKQDILVHKTFDKTHQGKRKQFFCQDLAGGT